jgi:glucitol operon activator protein
MFDEIAANAGIILVLLVTMWIAQFGLTYWQIKKFNTRLKALRQGGLTAVGLGSGRFKGRNYAILTIDQDDIVVHAEKFGGWSTFSKLRPVPDLIGLSLQDVLTNENRLPVTKKLQTAFGNAARDLQKAREDALETEQLQPA